MAGRPITNNSRRAQKKREHMRQLREQARPPSFNPQPLAQVLANWKAHDRTL